MTGKHSSENTRGCPGLLQESFIVREERMPASGGRGNGLSAAQRTLSVSAGGTKGLGSIKSFERRPGPVSHTGDEEQAPLGGSAEPIVVCLKSRHSCESPPHCLSHVCACLCLGLTVVTTYKESKMSPFFFLSL